MAVDLSYRQFGAGPPVIILHGLFGSGSNWGTVARALAARHRVYAVDQRNHGDSPHTETMGYIEMAQDVFAFMDKHSLSRATLLGHSMGGKVAMAAALTQPRRVQKLIVADIAPVRYHRDYSRVLEAMRKIQLKWVGRRDDAERQMAAKISDRGLRLFLLKNLVSDGRGYRWRINLDGIESRLNDLLGFPRTGLNRRYTGQTLFVHGVQSDFVLPAHHSEIRLRFPQAEILGLQGAGHWLHVEQPQAFLNAVRPFLGAELGSARVP